MQTVPHVLPRCQARITIDRDPGYAPCCYLICRVDPRGDWDTREEASTVLVQTDWDWPGVARAFGWDGDDSDIAEAGAFLDDHLGESVEDPGYFG